MRCVLPSFILFLVVASVNAGDSADLGRWLAERRSFDPEERLAAEGGFNRMGNRLLPALLPFLSDNDPQVRFDAIEVLGEHPIDIPRALALLMRGLADADGSVRMAAADALGSVGPEAECAVPALIAALKDDEYLVRQSAARSLGRLGCGASAAIPALIEKLRDPVSNVSYYSRRSLVTLGRACDGRDRIIAALLSDVHQADRSFARERRAGEVYDTLWALTRIDPALPLVRGTLVQTLDDSLPDSRLLAAESLLETGHECGRASRVLRRALKNDDAGLRAFALDLLAGAGASAQRLAPDLEALLTPASEDDGWTCIPEKAGRALWRISGVAARALPALLWALSEPYCSTDAALTLSEMGPAATGAASALAAALEREQRKPRTDPISNVRIYELALARVTGRPTPRPAPPRFALYLLQDASLSAATASALPELHLQPEPLITEDDVESYDWLQHRILLGDGAGMVLRHLNAHVSQPIPFVLTADGERCYLGAFVPEWALAAPRLPFIPLTVDEGFGSLRILLASSPRPPVDPRNNSALCRVAIGLGWTSAESCGAAPTAEGAAR